MEKIPLAIMASGRGTNAEAIIQFCQQPEYCERLSVACLITDRPQAQCVDKARARGIQTHIIPFKRHPKNNYAQDKYHHEQSLLNILQEYHIQWVCFAGYMRILSENFLKYYFDDKLQSARVVNIHPSLLPLFPGKDSYRQAYEAGVQRSGVSLHFVDSGVDTGPILFQADFKRDYRDSLESFSAKGLALEYQLYKKFLQHLAAGEFQYVTNSIRS